MGLHAYDDWIGLEWSSGGRVCVIDCIPRHYLPASTRTRWRDSIAIQFCCYIFTNHSSEHTPVNIQHRSIHVTIFCRHVTNCFQDSDAVAKCFNFQRFAQIIIIALHSLVNNPLTSTSSSMPWYKTHISVLEYIHIHG